MITCFDELSLSLIWVQVSEIDENLLAFQLEKMFLIWSLVVSSRIVESVSESLSGMNY